MTAPGATQCRDCPALVVWVFTPAGKRMPVDALESPGGNVACYRDAHGTWLGRVMTKDEEPLPFERLHVSHFATCTGKHGKPGKAKPLPPNVLAFPAGGRRGR